MSSEIKTRIAALLRKARDAGSSEAEAMAAAQRAADIMREHGLSEVDVEFEESNAPLKTKGKSPRDQLWMTVARCTNTAFIMTTDWAPFLTFVGKAPGAQIAAYLVDVLNRAVDREIEQFRRSKEFQRRRTVATRRAAAQDFQVGLVARLRVRLLEMFSGSMSAPALATARAVLDAKFPAQHSIKQPERKVRFGNAAQAGYTAGGRVQLAHGVDGQKPVRQIGRAS